MLMKQAACRFYAQLNDFLPPSRRQLTFAHAFEGRVSVKDLIEALGVPHTEIALILVNGESMDFSYPVQAGDRISVYPMFESIDITPLVRVAPRLLHEPRFVVDAHLGRLAKYLRMLGFDTLYRNDYPDEELARIASRERRMLLTREPGLLKRSVVTYGYWVRAADPREQIVEILQRFDLVGAVAPFQRCLRCNGLLQRVGKESIDDRLLSKTKELYDEFYSCQACGQIYWKGSHYERMRGFIEGLLRESVNARGLTGREQNG